MAKKGKTWRDGAPRPPRNRRISDGLFRLIELAAAGQNPFPDNGEMMRDLVQWRREQLDWRGNNADADDALAA